MMDERYISFFEQLYRDNAPKLLSLACIKVKNLHRAEDIVQDTFAAAEREIESLVESPNPVGWLYINLKYKVKHEVRAEQRYRNITAKLARENRLNWKKIDGNISDYKDMVTESEYKILKLIYEDEYTIKEIAEMTGDSYESCKKRAQRAKQKILEKLA